MRETCLKDVSDPNTLMLEQRERVLVIRLNRPKRRNAWNYVMHGELDQIVRAANADPHIEGIVVTGEGDYFCAGADVVDVFSLSHEDKKALRESKRVFDWVNLMRSSKPVVAAVNGTAIGIGVTLAVSMDQILATEQASFAPSFVKFGVVPELASSNLIERRIGFGAAHRLILTGDTIDAREALRLALIDQVVAAEELLDQAVSLAGRMGCNPHFAIRETKALLAANPALEDLDQVQQREREALDRCYASAEHLEAVAAFREKRPADFQAARVRGQVGGVAKDSV